MYSPTRSYPHLLLIALVAALSVTIVLAAGTSSASLGIYNPTWDGTSELRSAASTEDTRTIIARNTTTYQNIDYNRTIAIVLSPSEPYDNETTDEISGFVRSGGTLLVAGDYGPHANQLLTAVGADAQITGIPLRDERRAGPSPAFPRVMPVSNGTYTAGVNSILLNHGSTVDAGGATPLFQSSEYSYLDTNGNEALGNNEVLTRRPVVTTEPVGNGTVIVVSDPSVFLNTMLDRADNEVFVRNLVDSHDIVVLDVTHVASLPPLAAVRLSLEQSPLLLCFVGTLSVVGLILGSYPITAARQHRTNDSAPKQSPTADEVATTVQKPGWDEKRTARITDSLMLPREEDEQDE